MTKNPTIAIIGLGYVGLPLAVAFAEKYKVIGFDINEKRVSELKEAIDTTLEITTPELIKVLHPDGLIITNNPDAIDKAHVFIIAVPTPTNHNNESVLTPLIKACETVAEALESPKVVIIESTVYPGVTEEILVPILEKESGLKYNEDFFVGYSPERINPGDKKHTVTKILKVTSGSTPESAKYIDELYSSIITAGTYLAPSIKVAEAAKVIENTQRDINIAFMNELAKIFSLLDIDTQEVLDAAATKWNFLKFTPGLVGGHCIGVDPYYLAEKARAEGYNPELILAARRLNDGMGAYVGREVIKLMIKKNKQINGGNVLVLGITFKENCPDIRNSKVVDIISELEKFYVNVDVYDPWANYDNVKNAFGVTLIHKDDLRDDYDGIVLAVAHDEFKTYANINIGGAVVYDVKSILPKEITDDRL
tara:strand:+ start:175730 stop:176998 length:1269 start_codon:yes stop_codon:yes gene_type:complete